MFKAQALQGIRLRCRCMCKWQLRCNIMTLIHTNRHVPYTQIKQRCGMAARYTIGRISPLCSRRLFIQVTNHFLSLNVSSTNHTIHLFKLSHGTQAVPISKHRSTITSIILLDRTLSEHQSQSLWSKKSLREKRQAHLHQTSLAWQRSFNHLVLDSSTETGQSGLASQKNDEEQRLI